MLCQTIKTGTECALMTKKGCSFNGGSCHIIVEQCEGCNKVMEVASDKYCRVYPDPAAKWKVRSCPTASHLKLDAKESNQKVNPLKASKRANKK